MTVHYLRGLSVKEIEQVSARAYSMVQRGLARGWDVDRTDSGERYVNIESAYADAQAWSGFTVCREDGVCYARWLDDHGPRNLASDFSLSAVLARLP